MKTKMTPSGRELAEYEFVLILDGVSEVGVEIEDALFAAGCDDATISLCFGTVYLTFSRKASSMKDAVLSAIRDVRGASIGARAREPP